MIASGVHAASFNSPQKGVWHDSVSDNARIGRPGRDRGVGGIFMSAEIIRFIPRPNHRRPTDFPTIAFRSAAQPRDLATEYVDTAPCELAWPDEADSGSNET
jgi:hypothetical protein